MSSINATALSASLWRRLIVSSDPETVQHLTNSMQQLALYPEVSMTVAAALQLLNQQKFEAIVVDLRLGEDAKTITEQVRLSRSSGGRVESAAASEIGATFVLERPISPPLIDRIFKAAYGFDRARAKALLPLPYCDSGNAASTSNARYPLPDRRH